MELGKTQVPRVIPTGKVYRQMFDAESQLVSALERSSAKGNGLSRHQTENDLVGSRDQEGPAASGVKSANVPLVRDTRTLASAGMLDERQVTWSQGFSNDVHVENPVLYKFYSEGLTHETSASESVRASQEVRGLPDVLTTAKAGSDIIERIAENRKQRHEQTLEEMYQDLGIIASELEPLIAATGTDLMEKLSGDDVIIESLIAQIENDEDLVKYTCTQLDELWEEMAKHSEGRQSWINNFDKQLSQLEEERMKRIQEVLQNYAQQLEKIAHLMPPDLHRLLDKETQLINQAVLSNRRAYADLYTRLMMTDIEREKKLHIAWNKRVDDWKELHTQLVLQKFKSFMESEEVVDPPGVAKVLEEMRTEQRAVNQKRLDLIDSLKDFKPPSSTKTAVYKWNQQITSASKEIDQLNQEFFNRLYSEYEKVCQECLRQVDILKADLLERGICTDQKAKQVVNEQCLPLVGERQSLFEKALEEMDKSLEAHNSRVLLSLKSLFKFTQGAAHVWDVHELGLAKQERALQEKLNEARHYHDTENQDREANLDITMDRMRQDSTEDDLKQSLTDALALLDQIKISYDEFHEKQKTIVESYPGMVEKELKILDGTVCKFFAVDRNSPENEGQKGKKEEKKIDTEEKKTEKGEEEEDKVKKITKKKKKAKGLRAGSRASIDGIEGSMIPLAVSEVLSTAKGTTFYVLTIAGEHGILPESSDGEEDSAKVPYLENVDISDRAVNEIKMRIRLNFLDHLEDWMDNARDRAKGVIAAKNEELNSELDLRMHLHQPRSRRTELDVHNVRAAELVMHLERVERHCKGINQALSDLKNRFSEMTLEHDGLAEKFREDIVALEIVFINATKSSRIIALSNQLQVEQEKYMTVIRTSLRQFRQDLENTLQMIRESNARFMKSFKLFSDGGNFCPEEIEEYRKRLEKMSQKMDSVEGFIMADLEGMESKRLEQASKVSAEFEDRFKHHMIDLVFMEKIARWLTNTQVKIKAEVANSNSQAQNLTQLLSDLARKIDACLRPNLDKEVVSPAQLNDLVKVMFEAFKERSVYLNCMKDLSAPRPASGKALQGNPALAMLSEGSETKERPSTAGSESSTTSSKGARVGFVSDSMPAASRPGKQPSEDPSVGIIKNILKTQKSRIMKAEQSNVDGGTGATVGVPEGPDKKGKSRPTTDQDKPKKPSRQGTANNSLPDKSQTARYGSTDTLQSSLKSSSMATIIMAKRKAKGQKLDKKYFVFGEKEEPGEEIHILGKVTKILRDALDGLLAAAEMYYIRQKGNRSVTRPQALQDTFESCADILIQKLQSYKGQADEYNNQCLQEFREQLSKLEKLTSEVPQCLIDELLKNTQAEMDGQTDEMNGVFMGKHQTWHKMRTENEQLLRPTLGHPQKAAELVILCEKEEARKKEVLEAIEVHASELQLSVAARAKLFVENLAKLSEELLLQFDELLTVDDIEKGKVPETKYPTSELIRRKNEGKPLVDEEITETMSRKKITWQGLPKNEFALPEPQSAPPDRRTSIKLSKSAKLQPVMNTTASVTSAKTTLGHLATEKARDAAYEEFKAYHNEMLASIRDRKDQQVVSEQRWTDSWNASVDKVKQLY